MSLSKRKSAGRLYNRILASLPDRELEDISPHAQLISVDRGQVLYEPNAPMECAYFLNSGLDSIVAAMKNGDSTEVALTGREGFLGASLFLGVNSTPYRALVQVPGEAFAVEAGVFPKIVRRNETFRNLVERFIQAHTVQTMQTAACNRLHEIDQRLARWLLLARDRLGSDSIPITHEFLGVMLGVRRESVTIAIKVLEATECIQSRRGLLIVADREHLERCSCECYRVVRSEFDRLLFGKHG